MKPYLNLADVGGLGRFLLDGARLITDVVEHAHATVLEQVTRPFPPAVTTLLGVSPGGRTGAIPGLVYRSIRAGYTVAERGMDLSASFLEPASPDLSSSTPERERMLAMLNGVWGHHLAARGNSLAIEMTFRHQGVPLELEANTIRAALGVPGRKLLVLVHGLCMNELSWRQEGHDYGTDLARDLGFTPVYVHYNTGLHTSTNGKCLAELLETLVAEWPEPVEELTLLGHSMGGLVARSAAHYGEAAGHTWRGLLRRLVFLGTPHHGSRLERAGNRVDHLLDSSPLSAPYKRLGTSRSAGITDLRHGCVIDEDWQDIDRFGHRHDVRQPLRLPGDVQSYAVAATLGMKPGDAKDRLLGDGLVPLDSALGIHHEPERCCAFPEPQRWVLYGMSHLELQRNSDVYAKLREWLAG